jgi:hypothetical protein
MSVKQKWKFTKFFNIVTKFEDTYHTCYNGWKLRPHFNILYFSMYAAQMERVTYTHII